MIIKFIKKHSWILVLFFVVILLPQSLNLQTKLDGRIIVTGIAIDKENDEYVVTAQGLTSGSGVVSNGKNVGMDFISAKGKTVREAITKLATETGKSTGVAQINYIIFGSSVFDEEISSLTDFVARIAQIDTSVLLLVAKNAGKELRKTKDLETGTAISLRKTFISKQKESNAILTLANDFLSSKFNPSGFCALNYFEIDSEQTKDLSSVQSNSPSIASTTEENGEENSNNGEQLTKQGRIVFKTPIALFSFGRYVGALETQDEIDGYLFANSKSKKGTYAFENIKLEQDTTAKISLFCSKKKSKTSVSIKNGIPQAKIEVSLSGNEIKEIIATDSNLSIYNAEKTYFSKDVQNQVADIIKSKIQTAFFKSKELGVDAFSLATKLKRHHNKEFKQYFSSKTLKDFINEVQLDIKVKVSSAK